MPPAPPQATDLQTIPGVGPRVSEAFHDLGIDSVEELVGQSPRALYERMQLREGPQDRCVLYVFRCAVYFAEHPEPDPELLLWWRWKDRLYPGE